MTGWTQLEGAPDAIGSEGGRIRVDEEHPLGARITLEEGGTIAPWSITCGVYGWMMHTVFCSSEIECRETYQGMKAGLDAIMDMIPRNDDLDAEAQTEAVADAIQVFIARFP